MSRSLNVWFNEHLIGVLSEDNNIWQFSYADDWSAFSLAPSLPLEEKVIIDGSTDRPVQSYFDNLLPEERAREVLARDAKIKDADSFSLLAYYGQESAGSLTLLEPGEIVSKEGTQDLSFKNLSQRIAKLPIEPLSHESPKKMSLAGAQHKLPVIVDKNGGLKEPVGHTPSTHILKPEHPDQDKYHHSVINEWYCMTLADRMGLDVPSVDVKYVPDPVYLIERFDREYREDQLNRMHTLDACQLLGFSSTYKYRESSAEKYAQIIDRVHNKVVTRKSLFEWTLFNYLVGNSDAHLKNLSFFITPGGIEIAPFYDLLSTEVYENPHDWAENELSVRIGDAGKYTEVTHDSFMQFAETIGIPVKAATSWKSRLTKHFFALSGKLLDQYEAGELIDTPRENKAGELRLLREIHFRIIQENLQRMA